MSSIPDPAGDSRPTEHSTSWRLTEGGVIAVRCSCGQWEGVAPSVAVAERDAATHRGESLDHRESGDPA